VKNTTILISREARQVILYTPMKELRQVIRKALSSANINDTIEKQRITHVVLIGGSYFIQYSNHILDQFVHQMITKPID
jgi:hypothetical protein